MPVRQGLWATLCAALLCSAVAADPGGSPTTKADRMSPASPDRVAVETRKPSETSADHDVPREVKHAGPHDWLIKHPTIERLLELHNQARARAGLAPLALNPDMCLAAQRHANWMASYGSFSHSGLPYRENIAYSQRSPEQAVQSWTYSPGHYANMCSGRECGFGYQTRGGVGYWVAVFR